MTATRGARKQVRSIGQLLLMAAMMTAGYARGDAPATGPAATPIAAPTTAPATAPGARDIRAIMQDIDAAGKELQPVFSTPAVITDATQRAAAAPKALPLLKKILALTDELTHLGDDQSKMIGQQIHGQLLPILLTFGDDQSQADAVKAAAGQDVEAARSAKIALLMSGWWKADKDVAAQTKLLDDATALAKASPDKPDVAKALLTMSQVGAASPDLTTKMQDILLNNMKGDFMDQAKQVIDGSRKVQALMGKPMSINGTTVDGKPFSTDAWKGKVILVDFWATWYDPNKDELPRLKKVFADQHDKGLEVLGVSNDATVDDLKKFLAADPTITWPQLFDVKSAGDQQWNSITTGFGITGIPTMFLIDRKGICRSVTARDELEDLVPKLIAEQ